MIDLFGLPLNVGDEILYTTGSQSNTDINRGTIVEIDENYWEKSYSRRTRSGSPAALIRTENGRKASIWRGRYELVSVTPFKQLHPELFI